MKLEKKTKYEVHRETFQTNESTKIEQAFGNINRNSSRFVEGDIVITEDNRLQQIGNVLTPDKAMELLKSNSLKAFYPIESQVELD